MRLQEGRKDLVDLGLVSFVTLRIDQVPLLKEINDLLYKVLLVGVVFILFIFFILIILQLFLLLALDIGISSTLVDLWRADGGDLAQFLHIEGLSLVVVGGRNERGTGGATLHGS